MAESQSITTCCFSHTVRKAGQWKEGRIGAPVLKLLGLKDGKREQKKRSQSFEPAGALQLHFWEEVALLKERIT
jgi:hypothetical protein